MTERGTSLIELLVAVALIAIVMVAIAANTIYGFRVSNQAKRNMNAVALAQEKMEQMAAVDPETLDDTDDLTETVTRENVSYTRVTNVTINADRARGVAITVSATTPGFGGNAALENSFALWGMR